LSAVVVSAASLDEALDALLPATPRSVVLAGGTDVMVELHAGRRQPDRVVDIWRVAELRGIAREGGGLRVGALTTCAELERSPAVASTCDILSAAAREVGAGQIKSRATLGGNLGTASPAADLVPALLAVGAAVRLRSRDAVRDVPIAEFVIGYRSTARRPDELIESVLVPGPLPGERRAFRKVGTRRAQSISKVVIALSLRIVDGVVTGARAAAGSVADRTILLPGFAAELFGHAPTPERIAAAARRAASEDAAPIDDVRSTALYRREVLRRVLENAALGAPG
jgi:CO/xanthine dehydrogenase FAD-binding subunit